jgi:hypothetical protein
MKTLSSTDMILIILIVAVIGLYPFSRYLWQEIRHPKQGGGASDE